MYFDTKSYLKSIRNHTAKHALYLTCCYLSRNDCGSDKYFIWNYGSGGNLKYFLLLKEIIIKKLIFILVY
jgi:hypothetical protein